MKYVLSVHFGTNMTEQKQPNNLVELPGFPDILSGNQVSSNEYSAVSWLTQGRIKYSLSFIICIFFFVHRNSTGNKSTCK